MITREIVFKKLDENRLKLRQFGVKKLGLFGSYARQEAREQSDLDFIVEFDGVSFHAYMKLKFFLEDLFKIKVDLVIAENIKPRLRHNILSEARYVQGL